MNATGGNPWGRRVVIALPYLWLIAPKLLPKRRIDLEDPSPRLFEARLHIDEHSAVVNRTRRFWRQAATQRAVRRCVFPVPQSPMNTTGSVRSM